MFARIHIRTGGLDFHVHFPIQSFGSVGGEARSPAGVVHLCTKPPHLERIGLLEKCILYRGPGRVGSRLCRTGSRKNGEGISGNC